MFSVNKCLVMLAIVAVFSSCKSKNVEQESVNPIVSTNNGKVQGVLVDDGKTTPCRIKIRFNVPDRRM